MRSEKITAVIHKHFLQVRARSKAACLRQVVLPRVVRVFLALGLFISLAPDCPITVTPSSSVEASLNGAIDAINAAPTSWDQTLQDLINKLKQDSGDLATQVLNQVSAVYTGALGQTQSVTFCGVDFFANRVTERLEAIRHNLFPQYPAPTIVPVVCITSPKDRVTPGTDQAVTYYGYDFLAFQSSRPFTADIEYGGNVAIASFGTISVTSNYQVELEFQSFDWSSVSPTRGPQMFLKWGTDRASGSALPIIFPALPTPTPTPVISRQTQDFNVNVHANSGGLPFGSGECKKIEDQAQGTIHISPGWNIDGALGDPGHPGVHEQAVSDNNQSRSSLRGYNYQEISNSSVAISGTICGACCDGAGAIFDRTYRVFEVKTG